MPGERKDATIANKECRLPEGEYMGIFWSYLGIHFQSLSVKAEQVQYSQELEFCTAWVYCENEFIRWVNLKKIINER